MSQIKNRFKGGTKKGRQHAHNEKTGKYARQFARTEANKARKRAKYLKNHPNVKAAPAA